MASQMYFLEDAKAKSLTFFALKCQVLDFLDFNFSAFSASS